MPLETKLRLLAKNYAIALNKKIENRVIEMKQDNQSHLLIYKVLGITEKEGEMIDIYQNKGRFLYKYAGSFLEEATKQCFKHQFPHAATAKVANTSGQKPKTFEIDCLIDKDAIEIKWRDATTDGDHINKEHARIKAIAKAGFTPIRLMFYYPNRTQAKKTQETLETLYKGINGQYYWGNHAWEYVRKRTGFDLKQLLEKIAEENTHANK